MTGNAGAHDICLSCRNSHGSVEHYYHYLFGYLLPLVMGHQRLLRRPGLGNIYVRSCAIMDAHTHSLKLEKLVILPREAHQALAESHTSPTGRPLLQLTLNGLDHPAHYRAGALLTGVNIVCQRLAADTAQYQRPQASGGPNILLINRDKPAPFYLSGQAESGGSAGADRRSLPNFDDIAAAIKACSDNVTEIRLENRSLAEQIALFRQADIVIGQHGAALANLIWCRSTVSLIEIYPDMGESGKRLHFQRLMEALGLAYQEVAQGSIHSPVPPDHVTAAIRRLRPRPSQHLAWRWKRLRHALGQRYDTLLGRGKPTSLSPRQSSISSK